MSENNENDDRPDRKSTRKKSERLNAQDTKENHFSFRHFINQSKISTNRSNANLNASGSGAVNEHQSLLPDFVQDHIVVESMMQSSDQTVPSPLDLPSTSVATENSISSYEALTTGPVEGRSLCAISRPQHCDLSSATDEAKINQSLPDFLAHNVSKRSFESSSVGDNLTDGDLHNQNQVSLTNHRFENYYKKMYEAELSRSNNLHHKNEEDHLQILLLMGRLRECEDVLERKNTELLAAKKTISELEETIRKLRKHDLERDHKNTNETSACKNGPSTTNGDSSSVDRDHRLEDMTSRADSLAHDLSEIIANIRMEIAENPKKNASQ